MYIERFFLKNHLNIISRIRNDSMLTLINSGVSIFMAFLLMKLAIMSIGIEARGLFVLVQTGALFIVNVIRLGLHQRFLMNLGDKNREILLSGLFTLSLYQAAVSSLISILITSTLIEQCQYGCGESTPYAVAFYVFTLLIYSTLTHVLLMIGNLIKVIEQTFIFYLTVVLIVVVLDRLEISSLSGFIWAFGVGQLLCILHALFVMNIQIRFVTKWLDIQAEMAAGAKIAGWSNLKDLMYKIDILLLPAILSPKNFGVYTILQNVWQLIWRVADPLVGIFNRELIRKSDRAMKNSFLVSLVVLLLFVGIIFGALVPFITEFFIPVSGLELGNSLFFVGFAAVFFVLWKIIAVSEMMQGKSALMYVSILGYLAGYCLVMPFISSISSAVLVVAGLMVLVTIFSIFYSTSLVGNIKP
jgi:O-antigen/teichoic acid export membrane protein